MALYKRGRYYYMDVYHDGRRIRVSLKTGNRREAQRRYDELRLALIRNELLGVKPKKAVRFKEAVKEYLEFSRNRKTESTYDRDLYRIKTILAAFGERLANRITPQDIDIYINRRADKVRPATVNREIAVLKAMFRKFEEWGYVERNPMKNIKFLDEPLGRVRYLLPHELDRFLKELEEFPQYFRAIVKMALFMGMRRGEILSLEVSDIDFNNALVFLRNTKNNRLRVIPLSPEVYKELIEMGIHRRKRGYVFLNPRTQEPYRYIKRQWKLLLKRAGIADFRFHDLRHTFASYLVMENVDLRTVQELLGHQSLIVTQRYANLSRAQLIDAINKLPGIVTKQSQSENSVEDEIAESPKIKNGPCRTRTCGHRIKNPVLYHLS